MIETDVQKLEPGSVIDLFDVDLTSVGGELIHLHPGKNNLLTDIVWNGVTYTAFPIVAEGFEATGNGRMPRPVVKVANVTGLISAALRDFDDMIGCKVTRRRTLAKYLDAVNFPARRNLLAYTSQLSYASYWANARSSMVADQVEAPDGTVAADKLIEDTASGPHYMYVNNLPVVAGQPYTFSIYAKAGSRDKCVLWVHEGATAVDMGRVVFDLATGKAIGTPVTNGAGVVQSYGSTDVGGGWWRLSITVLPGTAATIIDLLVTLANSSGQIGYAGDGAGHAYFWGAQCESGSALTAYQPVDGATFQQNPTADPTQEFPPEVWFVDRKASETKMVVELELAASWDVQGVLLPRRQAIANTCNWRYRGPDCGYAGGAVADSFDNPTTVLASDQCGKRLTSCKLRFGEHAVLPFGAFPSVGLIR